MFAAIVHDHQGPVTAIHAYRLDVRAERFADPQPVEGEERDQRVITRGTKAGLDEEAAELVAVQPEGAGLDIDLGASDVRCWVAFEDQEGCGLVSGGERYQVLGLDRPVSRCPPGFAGCERSRWRSACPAGVSVGGCWWCAMLAGWLVWRRGR